MTNSKGLKIVIGTIILLVIAYFVFNQSIINTYDGRTCVSFSLETSKKNNLYLGIYRPLKDSVTLKGKKIKTIDIWAEKRWTDGHSAIFFSEIYPDNNGINIIVPYKTSFDTVDFVVEPPDKNYIQRMGGRPGLGFVYSYTGIPDTIKLYLKQQKTDSWVESINVDSVNYVKGY
jgi:hypothetical protein